MKCIKTLPDWYLKVLKKIKVGESSLKIIDLMNKKEDFDDSKNLFLDTMREHPFQGLQYLNMTKSNIYSHQLQEKLKFLELLIDTK